MATYKTPYAQEDLEFIQTCYELMGNQKTQEAEEKLLQALQDIPEGFSFDQWIEPYIYQYILGKNKEPFKTNTTKPVSQLYYVLGVCYLKEGHEEKAKEAFETCLTYNPVFIYAMNKLAIIAMNQKDIQTFFKYFARAYVCSYTPNQYKDVYETLSLLFLSRRDLNHHLILLEVANACEYDPRLMNRMQAVKDHAMVNLTNQSLEDLKTTMGLQIEASTPLMDLLKILESKGQDCHYYRALYETLEEMNQRLSIY